jgi:uncharacterized membrane protein YtjA (UPF0391 family)
MLYYALIFLLVGSVAGALGLFGVPQIASQISWILFLIGRASNCALPFSRAPNYPISCMGVVGGAATILACP